MSRQKGQFVLSAGGKLARAAKDGEKYHSRVLPRKILFFAMLSTQKREEVKFSGKL